MDKELHDIDPELIAKLKSGDALALATLVERRYGQLCALAGTILSDKTQTEDIVMDGIVMFWQQRGQLDANANPYQLLSVMVIRRACSYNRDNPQSLKTAASELLLEQEDGRPSPEDLVESKMRVEKVKSALEELPPDQIRMLRLSMDGYTRKEISKKTGIPFWRVKRELEKARATLRKKLGDDDDFIEEH